MQVFSRQYRDEEDYRRLQRLLQEVRATGHSACYLSAGVLDYIRFAHEESAATVASMRLWEESSTGRLVGGAWPDQEQVDVFSHPLHRGLEDEMLGWAECQRRTMRPDGHAPWYLRVEAATDDPERQAILRRRGYTKTGECAYRAKRDLGEPILEPDLPGGYRVCTVSETRDPAGRVECQRCSFGHGHTSLSRYLAMMHAAPTYRPELDLVVTAPDGEVVAFCGAWYDDVNRAGDIEPLGCHPRHRRLGLARNLLWEALRRLKHLGAFVTYVATGGHNSSAQRLYASVGFRQIGRVYEWQKLL